LTDFPQSKNSEDKVAGKIENIDQDQDQKEKSSGIKPNQAVEMVASFSSAFIPNIEVQTQNGYVNLREDYKNSYKNKDLDTFLDMIDFEELTEGGDLSEMPEWLRWTFAGGVLIVPATISVISIRKQVSKMQESKKPNKNKNENKKKEGE